MEYADSTFEIKTLDDAGHIEGLAAGFGDVDHGGDKILFGAFTKTLAARGERPIPMLHSHDLKRPIGAWKTWEERPEGLYLKGKMTLATRDAQEAHALAKDGALTGLSIGWKATSPVRFEGKTRILPEVELFETSLVAVPMHDRTRVLAVKEITRAQDIREMLQSAGVPRSRANIAADAAWKAINSTEEAGAEAEFADIIKQSVTRLNALRRAA